MILSNTSEDMAEKEAERQCADPEQLTSEDARWEDGATWEE